MLRILLVLASGGAQRRRLGAFRAKGPSDSGDHRNRSGSGSSSSSSTVSSSSSSGQAVSQGQGQGQSVGDMRGSLDDSESDSSDLLSFLYLNCLFPKDIADTTTTTTATATSNSTNNSINKSSIAGQSQSQSQQPPQQPLDVTFGALCQTKTSRALAYTLIFQLCRYDEQNLLRVVRVMNSVAGDYSGNTPSHAPPHVSFPIHILSYYTLSYTLSPYTLASPLTLTISHTHPLTLLSSPPLSPTLPLLSLPSYPHTPYPPTTYPPQPTPTELTSSASPPADAPCLPAVPAPPPLPPPPQLQE